MLEASITHTFRVKYLKDIFENKSKLYSGKQCKERDLIGKYSYNYYF